MTVEMRLNCTGSWTDYTDSVDISELKLNRSLDTNNDPQHTSTSTIEVFEDAYTFVLSNLYTGSNRYSNSICVRITDTDCSDKQYEFKIDNRDIRWCDNDECRLQCDLIGYQVTLDCIRKTRLAYNNSGEFNDYPGSGTPHPRFRYCDTIKPTFLFGFVITLSNAIAAFIISLNLVLASITGIIVWIVNLLGGSWTVPQISYSLAADLIGCNRGHPAPFVRTYIDNVCTECAITVDGSSAPWLYNTTYNDGFNIYDNPYYYLCLLTSYTTKGVDMDGGKDYILANQPSWMLDKFLSILKPFFNARWFLDENNVLYFNRRDEIGDSIWGVGAIAVDLSGSDAANLLDTVCYKWNGKGKPKRIRYLYGTDATDAVGNELRKRFNGEYLETSGNENYNDNLEENNYEFGATAAVLDGQDSAYDANLVNALAATLGSVDYEGCLKTTSDTNSLAKLLIWDWNLSSMDDARMYWSDYDIYGSAGADIEAFKRDDANFFPVASADCANYNFPMSFDPDADDIGGNNFRNLWMHHSIDANNDDSNVNIGFEFKLSFCCQYNTLEVYQKVLFKDGSTTGEITSVDFDFGKREITIKGNLI